MAVSPIRVALWVVCLAALCASAANLWTLPLDFRPGPNHPGWLPRYESLVEPLGDDPEAILVTDDEGGTPDFKTFRAQFALAPVLVEPRSRLGSIDIRRLVRTPLILDASSPASLEAMTAQIAGRADRWGFALDVERVRRNLALVRARERP